MIEKLNPVEVSAIVVGSLLLTLLVFFSGFIVGWLRSRFRQWRGGGSGGGSGAGEQNGVEFSKLDALVSNSEEL
jgi:predicted permease